MKTQNIIPASIEMRAMKFISKGVDVIEAVKMAIEEEMNFLGSLYDGGFLSERGKKVNDIMMPIVYEKLK